MTDEVLIDEDEDVEADAPEPEPDGVPDDEGVESVEDMPTDELPGPDGDQMDLAETMAREHPEVA